MYTAVRLFWRVLQILSPRVLSDKPRRELLVDAAWLFSGVSAVALTIRLWNRILTTRRAKTGSGPSSTPKVSPFPELDFGVEAELIQQLQQAVVSSSNTPSTALLRLPLRKFAFVELVCSKVFRSWNCGWASRVVRLSATGVFESMQWRGHEWMSDIGHWLFCAASSSLPFPMLWYDRAIL